MALVPSGGERSRAPALTGGQVKNFLISTAIDIEAAGVDRDSGYGILDAYAAAQATGVAPRAFLLVKSFRILEDSPSNKNGLPDPGEKIKLQMLLWNPSTNATATGVQVAISSPPAGLNFAAASVSVGNMAANAQATAEFVVNISALCGTRFLLPFVMSYSNSGGNSPQTFYAELLIGRELAIASVLDSTPPPSTAAYSASTGIQTGRIVRDGLRSFCVAGKKTYPGNNDVTIQRRYDACAVANGSSLPQCVEVRLDALHNSGNWALLPVAYDGAGFVPGTPSANYLADPGSSATSIDFAFPVAAGQNFTLVVHEVNAGLGTGLGVGDYRLRIKGVVGSCGLFQTALPLVQSGSRKLGIWGRVTEKLNPAPGIPVTLRLFNGSTWSTASSSATDSAGLYSIKDAPSLASGQEYIVQYSNTADPNRLYSWETRSISSYVAGQEILLGNFDISEADLNAPADGATVSLPATFSWFRRPGIPDSYEFNIYDPADGNPWWWIEVLYSSSYTMNSRPSGFLTGIRYLWDIWIYGPDGGTGIGFADRNVTFASSAQLESGHRSSGASPGTRTVVRAGPRWAIIDDGQSSDPSNDSKYKIPAQRMPVR